MGQDLDLRRLRSFVQVAELQSFTKAATMARVAQSALSRQIRELEAQFGEPLFYRTGHGASLTSFGLEIMPRVKALLLQADQLAQDIQAGQAVPAGDVSLAVLASLGPVLLTPLLDRVRHQFPGIRMRIVEGLAHHIEEWLTTGRVDIGILYETSRYRVPTSEVLFTPDMYLVARRGDRRVPDGTVPLKGISTLPLILPAPPNYHRALIERACTVNRVPLQISFEMDSTLSVVELVSLGGSYTILPLHAVIRHVKSRKVQASRIIRPAITRRVMLATPSQRPMSRATTEIVRLAREESRRLVAMLAESE